MSYIGVQPTAGQYRKLDDISGSFNGSTTTFTTQVGSQNVSAGTAQQLLVSLGGVIQNPITDYTVSTNSITFTTAPAAGLSFFAVLMGEAVNTGTPSDGVVTGAKLSAPFNYNSGLLYLDSSNNRVGIGTTSPSVPLHVEAASGEAFRASASGANQSIWSSYKGGSPNVADLRVGVDSAAGGTYGVGSGAVVWNAGNSPLAFGTNNTERARIDSSGRLLVGTSSTRTIGFWDTPQFLLEGTDYQKSSLCIYNNQNDVYGAVISLGHSRGTSVGSNTIVQNNDYLGALAFHGSDGGNEVRAAEITAYVDGTPGVNDMPCRLVFSTTADGASSPTESFRITNAGRAIFNRLGTPTDTDFVVQVFSDSTVGGVAVQTNQTGARTAIRFRNPNGIIGEIITNGSATAYNTSSDYRLKENVAAVADGIIRLQQLKPSRFNFKANPTNTVDGFIAHEVQAVVPEAVTGEKDAVDDDGNPIYQGIDQSKLVPLLTAALQEAIGEIESLKARLTAAGI